MDKFWESLRDVIDTSVLFILLGVALLVFSNANHLTIGQVSIDLVKTPVTQTIILVGAAVLIGLGFWRMSVHSRKTIKNRERIAAKNNQLIDNSKTEIVSYSGDLSWITNSHNALASAIDRGVRVRILCKDPITEKAKELVKTYIRQPGIEIRYYPPGQDPDVRGLMIEPATERRILIVEKRHRTKGYQYQRDGTPGTTATFEYWGQEFASDHDFAIVNPLTNYFNVLWDSAEKEVSVLGSQSWAEIELALRRVLQYQQATIKEKIVNLSDLKPLYRYVEAEKYERIKALAKRLGTHKMSLWRSFQMFTSQYRRLVCPPIVERHGTELVIVDGLKRIYHAREMEESVITVCLVEDIRAPLPGRPLEWEELVVDPIDGHTKFEKFKEFSQSDWRDLKTFHNSLIFRNE